MIERGAKAPIVNFAFFRSRTFLGANLVAFLISFAMFAQFFFLTLYLQNILHYTPLETGVRFLPSTIMIIIMGPLAGRLTDRVGSRPLMTLGLIIVAVSLAIESRLTVHSGYGLLLPGFVLMGLGMGLVMSPMSTAAMNVRRPHQGRRGVGPAVDDPHGREYVRSRRDGRARRHDRPLADRFGPSPRPSRDARGDRRCSRQRRHGRRSARAGPGRLGRPAGVRLRAGYGPHGQRCRHAAGRGRGLEADRAEDQAARRRPTRRTRKAPRKRRPPRSVWSESAHNCARRSDPPNWRC